MVKVVALFNAVGMGYRWNFLSVGWIEDRTESNGRWWAHLWVNVVVYYFFAGRGSDIIGATAFVAWIIALSVSEC